MRDDEADAVQGTIDVALTHGEINGGGRRVIVSVFVGLALLVFVVRYWRFVAQNNFRLTL